MWGQVDARYVMDIKGSYVLFVGTAVDPVRPVAAEFRARGAEVRVETDGEEAGNHLRADSRLPDVMFIHDTNASLDGMELTHLFKRHFPAARTKVICACNRRSNYNGVMGDWDWPVDSFVMRPYSLEQAVVAIEQMYFRDVQRPEAET